MNKFKVGLTVGYLVALATVVYAEMCANGMRSCEGSVECVHEELFCDTWEDCSNGFDERNEICSCKPNEFLCPNSTLCIPGFWQCDDQKDCPGGEDEVGCQCGGHVCPDGECIPGEWVCDEEPDCKDGSDEIGCPTKGPACGEGQFECNNGKCVPAHWNCDGWPDCDEGEDELNCPCKRFQCANGECIPSAWECDGEADCSDWSDELHCDCKENEFFCGACIPERYKCDCPVDCPDGSDEGDHCDYPMPCQTPPTGQKQPELTKRMKFLEQSHKQEISSRNGSPGSKAKLAMKIARRDSLRKVNLKLIQNQKSNSSVFLRQMRHSRNL